MARPFSISIEAFERAFDETFEELLIGPWRMVTPPAGLEQVMMFDHGDRYEVRMSVAGIDPRRIAVEVQDRRLTVRTPSPSGGFLDRSFAFDDPVDSARVTSRYADRTLVTVLPKKSPSRRSWRVEVTKG